MIGLECHRHAPHQLMQLVWRSDAGRLAFVVEVCPVLLHHVVLVHPYLLHPRVICPGKIGNGVGQLQCRHTARHQHVARTRHPQTQVVTKVAEPRWAFDWCRVEEQHPYPLVAPHQFLPQFPPTCRNRGKEHHVPRRTPHHRLKRLATSSLIIKESRVHEQIVGRPQLLIVRRG